MLKNRNKNLKTGLQKGFTLVELIVVLAIMGILLGSFTANIVGQRETRNLNIAQTELVTNIRKMQSSALSSRTINNGQAVQYYILKFDTATPTQYYLQAIYNAGTSPVLQTIETIKFPTGVHFTTASPMQINAANITQSCALIAFRLPFAKTIISDGCNVNSWDPTTDDYQKVINFVVNSTGSKVYSDSNLVLKFNYNTGTIVKTATLKGVTGTVLFQ